MYLRDLNNEHGLIFQAIYLEMSGEFDLFCYLINSDWGWWSSLLLNHQWEQSSQGKRWHNVVAHLSPMFESGFSTAHGKLCQSLSGLPPGIAQYRGLASEGRQRYENYINPPKISENK